MRCSRHVNWGGMDVKSEPRAEIVLSNGGVGINVNKCLHEEVIVSV